MNAIDSKNLLSKRKLISEHVFNEGEDFIVAGFLRGIRDLGKLVFSKIVDQSGSLQVIFSEASAKEISSLFDESVLIIKGKLKNRTERNICASEKYGKWELIPEKYFVLSQAYKPLPFRVSDKMSNPSENLRLKYRYLDLRLNLQKNLIFKSYILNFLKNYLIEKNFIEINTPALSVSSKEGANTFDTYVFKNEKDIKKKYLFSLSQSPQLYKQLLMMSGFEKYFQFANCFRNEDLRADRQYEFLQLDMELSFSTKENLFLMIEDLFKKLFQHQLFLNFFDSKPEISFSKISYFDSISKYSTDKPDLRLDLQIQDFSKEFSNICIKKNKKYSYGIFLEKDFCKNDENFFLNKVQDFSYDQEWSELKEFAENSIFCWNFKNKKSSNIKSSFFNKENLDTDVSIDIEKFAEKKEGMLFLVFSDISNENIHIHDEINRKFWFSLGKFRNFLVRKLNSNKNIFNFVWIVDWPLFEKNEGKWSPTHHLFTKPKYDEEIDFKKTISEGYDLVLNGVELASGSQRNHNIDVQKKIFKMSSLSDKEIDENFGWFLEAFNFGVPPHLGIAIGIDRLIKTFLNESSIREVIAFPKNSHGICPLTNSPIELKD